MPDWVRTMQAGQSSRGSMPAPEGVGFSARGLMNEDALPQWLREAGAGAGASGPPPPQPGYGAPGYGAAGGMGGDAGAPWNQGAGLQGPGYGQSPGQYGPTQSVYDESNLPEWLLQPGANGASSQQYDAFPTVRQPAPFGAPQPPAPGYNAAAAARQNAFPSIEQVGAYRPAPSGGLNGSSLLDDNALPGWMRGDPTPAQGDPAAAYRDAGGMRGSSLIDANALPAWMRNQPGAAGAQPISPAPPQAQPQPSAGPSIANWIGGSTANDPIPPWLGQAYSDARVPPLQAPAQVQVPPPQNSAGAGWPPNGVPPNGAGVPPLPGTLNANSLMDESALPSWLRAQGQPPAGDAMGNLGAMGAGGPPNMGPTPMGQPHSGTLADMHTVRMPHSARQAPPDAYAGEPEPQRFSASDLIDPDVLPGFIGGGNAGAMPPPPAQAPFGAPNGANGSRSRAPGSWAGREAEVDPERDQGYGRAARGAPIPEDELPEWLQGPEPFPMQRAGPSARRGGYDSQRVPVPRDWNDEQYDASEWSESYEDQDPAGYYEDEPPRRDRRAHGRGRRADRAGDERGGRRGGGGDGRPRERRGFFGR